MLKKCFQEECQVKDFRTNETCHVEAVSYPYVVKERERFILYTLLNSLVL